MIVGIIMFIHGVYQERFESLEKNVRVEYRFVPRTYYEEQLTDTSVASKFKGMFQKSTPWFDATIGEKIDTPDISAT